MLRKVVLFLAHLLFWGLAVYAISRIFGISTVEVFAEETSENNTTERVIVSYDHAFFWATLITVAFCAVAFYTNIFLLLRDYFIDKSTLRYFLKLFALLFLCVSADILLNRYITYGPTLEDGIFSFPSIGLHMTMFVFFTALSYVYAFIREWIKNEKLRNEIAKEKLKTELNFLKSQINPHFLFNTLNNLYSISQKHQVDELSMGINELSNLMRYMLYESNADFVSLKKEVKYIESFIEIQQLRHDEEDELIINFEKKGDFSKAVIAPMILLPFVENAFKHGFSLNESSVINLGLETSDSGIFFKVRNRAFKHHKFADKTSGIGLENVTRRLNLIYPNKHTLRILEEDENFIVELNIRPNE